MNGLKTGFRVPNQATKTMVLAAVLLQLQVSLFFSSHLADFPSFCSIENVQGLLVAK